MKFSVIFEILTTTASSSKAIVACLHMKTICAKQASVHLAYFVQHDQLGIITEHLTEHLTFSGSCCRSFLYYLLRERGVAINAMDKLMIG